MFTIDDFEIGQNVRGYFLDDETHSSTYGEVQTFDGKVIATDTSLFGGPYVVVDDGLTLWLADVSEIMEIYS